MPTSPHVAIGPFPADFAREAIVDGGGEVVEDLAIADGLVWLDPHGVDKLADALDAGPRIRWVQLPSAGIERVAGSGLLGPDRTWTCAKGAFAEPVAEHALALSLAGLRHLPERVRATSWGKPAGTSLYEGAVTIVGGGGIARALLEQMEPFRVRATVVRRTPEPTAGAVRTLPVTQLHDALPGSLLVVLALALTPETEHVIGAE